MALPEGVGHIGPYRVDCQLGAGGMGEVYKAFDDRLDRWVAIKRIRPEKEQAEDHRVRFRREARAAAKLNHSAIVHVYDIFQDGDSDCIVMELVEGRSLDQLLQDGPLPPMRAAEIGRQISAGLAEAHRKGILHRDLKTENIILTLEGDAKILDFGLAKPMVQGDLDSSLTGKGQVVGTSRAMSPEYVGGDEVDHRADLFSLGVLLYEAVTGQSPFKAHNTLATLKRVILYQQSPAHELNSAVPPELSTLIDQLLEKEPRDRISSAQEVVDRLDDILFLYGSGSSERPSPSSSRITQQLRRPVTARGKRRRLGLAAALALAVVATAVAFMWSRDDPTTQEQLAFEERDSIVIGQFVNRTEDSLFDEGLDLVFRVGIEQGNFANVLSEPQTREALQRMELDPETVVDQEKGIEIAQREGAKALVIGTIVKVGSAYSLTGEIIDPASGRTVFSESRSRSNQDDILVALGEVVEAIRSNLGESIGGATQQNELLAKVTTANLEALRSYSLGSSRLNRGNPEEAIVFLSRAIELDPEFAMAHAKLGTAYHNSSNDQLEKATLHYQQALQFSDRLSTSEELYVKGWIATWLESPAEMVDAWRLMTELVPDSFEAHHNLGMVYWNHLNQFEEAVEALHHAANLDHLETSQRLFGFYHLGFCQLALGQLQEALASFERASQDISPVGLALTRIAQGRHDLAQALIETERPDLLDPIEALSRHFVQQVIYLKRGNMDQALAHAIEGVTLAQASNHAFWEQSFRSLVLVARLHHREDQTFQETLENGLAEARQSAPGTNADRRFTEIPLLASLGKAAVRSGHLDQARAIAAEIDAYPEPVTIPQSAAYRRMLEAEILAAEEDWPRAFEVLRQASESFDAFQLHESLAHFARASGKTQDAIDEFVWMEQQGARVLAECRENCVDRIVNIMHQSLSSFYLGQLLETSGQRDLAAAAYSRFLDQWNEDDHPTVTVARERLKSLETAAP